MGSVSRLLIPNKLLPSYNSVLDLLAVSSDRERPGRHLHLGVVPFSPLVKHEHALKPRFKDDSRINLDHVKLRYAVGSATKFREQFRVLIRP